MVSQRYKDAYKEVLEIIKYLPENQLSKIPNEKIEYFKRNQNSNHVFYFDSTINLEEQNISREANAIILKLLNDYFLNNEGKDQLAQILRNNEIKYQKELQNKYSTDNIFQNRSNIIKNSNDNSLEEMALVQYKEMNFIQKIFNKIKEIFRKN